MLILIKPSDYDYYRDDLDNMYRLRHTVFFEKMNWHVTSLNGLERDTLDEHNMYYLIYKDEQGIIRGCIRFIEMIHPCMFDQDFKGTLPNINDFKKSGYWETSRFAVDTMLSSEYTLEMCKNVSKLILIGLMEFGIKSKHVETYMTLTYPSVKRLLKQNGLFIYDMTNIFFHNEKISIWAFPPMTYALNKLTQKLNGSTPKNSTYLIGHLITQNFPYLHEPYVMY